MQGYKLGLVSPATCLRHRLLVSNTTERCKLIVRGAIWLFLYPARALKTCYCRWDLCTSAFSDVLEIVVHSTHWYTISLRALSSDVGGACGGFYGSYQSSMPKHRSCTLWLLRLSQYQLWEVLVPLQNSAGPAVLHCAYCQYVICCSLLYQDNLICRGGSSNNAVILRG